MDYSIKDIAKRIGAELNLVNPNKTKITGVQGLEHAKETDISFLSNPKYIKSLASTKAAAVIVTKDQAVDQAINTLTMPNPQLGFIKVAALFATTVTGKSIHPSAIIDESASLASSVSIGANVVIGKHVTVGNDSIIAAGSVVEDGVIIGHGCQINANVTLCHDIILGDQCVIDAGAVIGSDGFGNVMDDGRWHKIPQLGRVVLKNDVHIGANTTIDRGTLQDTIIHAGARLDNLIQVAHNVIIGENTAIAAGSGIAGSTTIGRDCQIAGQVGIAGHLHIVDHVIVTGKGMVSKSITEPGIYSSGIPLRKNAIWRKNIAHLQRITHLFNRVKALEKRINSSIKGEK